MISVVPAAVAGVVGLVAGDYGTVLIERAPAARTVSGSARELRRHPAGECPRCAARLRAADLIPLVAWARTGGTCRYCGAAFGAWHPAAEILTAVTFALLGLGFGASPVLPAFCFLALVSVALTFIDVTHRRLPDLLTLPAYPVAIVALVVATPFVPHGPTHLVHAVIGLAGALAFYLVLAFVYPAGIGWGDVKLSGLLGLYLGWAGLSALVIGLAAGFVLAAVAGVALIAAGRATRRTQIAFGPFMVAGALAVIIVAGLA
jgi:leader peptidase (prepilin peptidase) / N-methyltransferase